MNKDNLVESKYQILTKLHECRIHYGAMSNFKDRLYNSQLTQQNGQLPLQEFHQIKNIVLNSRLDPVEELILKEIKVENS
mmetsp:Transcript_1893/g.1812  ORF Transcript_1893/g.1812 Transcript_1893/m.1812 type:complete len:80 (+) Transcript_1893:453-692(+)